jgi:class 3 adenylate cyclase
VGYTELSEQLDPEDLRDLQLQYQRLALTVMERYGGFVAQFSGDGVLVYFGYPAAHENDAERAVRAALELHDRLHELNAELRGQQLPEIAIRIGIHTGLIVIGSELASGGAQDHSIVGEAANLAARLQADAPTNSVIVSGETFEMISGMFDYPSGSRASVAALRSTRSPNLASGSGGRTIEDVVARHILSVAPNRSNVWLPAGTTRKRNPGARPF